MRTTSSMLISFILALTLCFSVCIAQAQTPPVHPGTILDVTDAPALTVSIRSANAALQASDITISKINEPLFKLYINIFRTYLSPDGPLGGFDLDRPFGIIIDPQYGAGALFPVQNWDIIQKNLKKNGGVLTPLDQNRYKFSKDDGQVYLRLQDNWLAVSTDNNAMLLQSIPQPCLDSLEQTSKIYLAGAVVNSSRMTTQQINDALKGIQTQLESALPSEGALADVLKKQIQSLSDSISQSIQRFQKDRLTFLLGLNFDPQSGFKMEVVLCTAPGTETAKKICQFKSSTTHLSGFYDPKAAAAISFSNLGLLSVFNNQPEFANALQNELYKQIEKNYSTERSADAIKNLANRLTTSISHAFSNSNNEMAVSIYASPKEGAAFVGAVYCENGQEIEDQVFNYVIKEALSLNTTMYSLYKGLNRNIGTINDVRLYTLTFSLSKEDENYEHWRKLLNSDDLVIAFGFGDNIACIAVGTDSLTHLKNALEKTNSIQKSPVFQYNIQYGTLVRFLETYYPMSEEQSQLLAKFKKLMKKQYDAPCQRTSVLFVEQTPSACAIRYQEEIPFDVVKFVTKFMKIGE